MRRLLLTLALLTAPAFAACTGSSPTWTSTPDSASVTTCIGSAVNGDTINVSAGSATWASLITVNKNLIIIGAGAGSTIISTNGFTLNPCNNPCRISGFTFNLGNGNATMIEGSQGYRFDHNTVSMPAWNFCLWPISSFSSPSTYSEGLIDHNTLTNCRIVVYGEWTSGGGTQGIYGWSAALNEGTSHANYIEDNTYCQSNSGNCPGGSSSDSINNFVDANFGGRYVARFNTVQNSYPEFHSPQGDGEQGARLAEIYDNTWNMNISGFQRTALLRAGTGMIFDNTYGAGWNSPVYDVDYVRTCNLGHTGDFPLWGFCGGNGGSGSVAVDGGGTVGYLCRNQPGASTQASLWSNNPNTPVPANTTQPWYIFHNLQSATLITWEHNGGSCSNGTQTANLASQIQANRDIYSDAGSFTGATGTGRGVRASRPGTCTTGVAWWATDAGSWNTNLSANTSGCLDVCTSTNTWTNCSYTPYTYPHPLIGGTAGSSYSPTSLAFGNQNTNITSSPQTITLTSSGGASLITTSIALQTGTQYAITGASTCVLSGQTLTAGSTCTIVVTFTPTTIGLKSDAVLVTSNSPTSIDNLSLSGTGVSAPAGGPVAANGGIKLSGSTVIK